MILSADLHKRSIKDIKDLPWFKLIKCNNEDGKSAAANFEKLVSLDYNKSYFIQGAYFSCFAWFI